MQVKTIGLDLAKDVFQVHGVSVTGDKVFNTKIKRAKLLEFFESLPRCAVGMEACGSAHHWGRALCKPEHDVRLIPATYVKQYVKRGETDAVDAEAICEAVGRSTMRFVETKTEDQQPLLTALRPQELQFMQGAACEPTQFHRFRAVWLTKKALHNLSGAALCKKARSAAGLFL